VRWEATERLGLQVCKDDDHLVLHTFDRNNLLESGSNLADFSVANIDLLTPKLLARWVLPDLHDFANTDVHLSDVRDFLCSGLCSRLWLLLLLLLLLLLGLCLFRSSLGLFTSGPLFGLGLSRLLGLSLLLDRLLILGRGSTGIRLLLLFGFFGSLQLSKLF
jgi:hypothetical protein